MLAAERDEIQQEQEQGDNVQIEVESSKHILLGRDCIVVFPTQDKLGITHQILQRERKSNEMLQHLRQRDERDRESVTRIGLKENTGSISYL